MNQLWLLRHAKSSWDDAGLSDHDRPLAPRGERAAKLISEHVRSEGIAPALVLCSSSRRTQETLAAIALPADADVRLEDDVYAASEEGLLERLRGVDDATGSVMVVGHNPGIAGLARLLARDGTELEGKYPTGALATLEFSGGWDALGPHVAELTGFVTPKGLARLG
jgi:phosphohistidine phosphatase